jgi:hypothetical protein
MWNIPQNRQEYRRSIFTQREKENWQTGQEGFS